MKRVLAAVRRGVLSGDLIMRTLVPLPEPQISAHAGYHAERVLAYLTSLAASTANPKVGTIPAPAGTNGTPPGVEGSGFMYAWLPVRRLLGAATPQSVLDVIAHPTIKASPATGALHYSCEAFADAGATGGATVVDLDQSLQA